MRALKQKGREEYRYWVEHLKSNRMAAPPLHLLTDSSTSYEIQETLKLPALDDLDKDLTKYDFIENAIAPVVSRLENAGLSFAHWPEIWDGLALHFFPVICPKDRKDQWKPYEPYHYVYTEDHKYRYRHQIYGAYTLYNTCRDGIRPFFQVKPFIHGDFEEQVGSRQELAGNPEVLAVLRILYATKDGKQKWGFTSRKKYKGYETAKPAEGTLRRFVDVCEQLQRTYDLREIRTDAFLQLLPREFDSWLADSRKK